jgi:hypothetical protein
VTPPITLNTLITLHTLATLITLIKLTTLWSENPHLEVVLSASHHHLTSRLNSQRHKLDSTRCSQGAEVPAHITSIGGGEQQMVR